MFKPNPYRAGAGLMPACLAGRDDDIDNAEQVFLAIKIGIPVPSIVYSGLRGVGKTVLVNKLQSIAEYKGIYCKHIEVSNKNDFISQISACSQAFLREFNTTEKLKHLLQKSIDAIKSLKISFDPNNSTMELSVQEREIYYSNNLTQSLTDVFTALGEVALEAEKPICYFIDEMQYMKQDELSSLVAALHRSNQLGYPIMIIGAGLPKVYKMLSDAKSYSERLFTYKEVGSLNKEQAKEAIEEPAKKLNVEYTEDAINRIYEITKGYPYFIQQFCYLIFQNRNNDTINDQDVNDTLEVFFRELDTGFFKVRYEKCSVTEKKFVFSMVKCDMLPCTISNVAKNMHRSVSRISPIRAQLINKGIIYPVKYSELDFTVPEFDGFIKRKEEYQQWLESTE